jgi:hypothetical protein
MLLLYEVTPQAVSFPYIIMWLLQVLSLIHVGLIQTYLPNILFQLSTLAVYTALFASILSTNKLFKLLDKPAYKKLLSFANLCLRYNFNFFNLLIQTQTLKFTSFSFSGAAAIAQSTLSCVNITLAILYYILDAMFLDNRFMNLSSD